MTRKTALVTSLLALVFCSILCTSAAADTRAGGGRTQPRPCAASPTLQKRVTCLVGAVAYQKRLRRHEAAVRYETSVSTAFQLAEIIYGMPSAQARGVGTCESGLDPNERNVETATGVMQELDSTFNRTPFGAVRIPHRIASFDPVVNILAAGYIWHRDGGSWREWDCRWAA